MHTLAVCCFAVFAVTAKVLGGGGDCPESKDQNGEGELQTSGASHDPNTGKSPFTTHTHTHTLCLTHSSSALAPALRHLF